MIVPNNNDRSWSKSMWKYLQRYERCVRRVMEGKWEQCFIDQIVYGAGYYDISESDMEQVIALMQGQKP